MSHVCSVTNKEKTTLICLRVRACAVRVPDSYLQVGGAPTLHRWSGECGDPVLRPETGGGPETFQAGRSANHCQ